MDKILILTAYFSPAYKGGGPIKSIQGVSSVLSEKKDVYVFCLDCDIDGLPLNIPKSNEWVDVGGVKVFYSSKKNILKNLFSVLKSKFDFLYLNSFFSFYFSIVPLLFNKFRGSIGKVILAPRGEFSPGALNIKNKKKERYLFWAKLFSFYNRDIIWHATSDLELCQINLALNKYLNISKANIRVAQNLALVSKDYKVKSIDKDYINLVFLSRISPKKNLKYALEVLSKCNLNINFDIWGPLENSLYWSECERLIVSLPSNITVNYKGSIAPLEVPKMLAEYDLFFFPTLGENFGHVIAESLSVGTPLLISDTTPWINLQKYGVGKEIDLKNMMEFVEFLEDFNRKTIQEKSLMRQKALEYFSNKFCGENIVNATYSLFKSDV